MLMMFHFIYYLTITGSWRWYSGVFQFTLQLAHFPSSTKLIYICFDLRKLPALCFFHPREFLIQFNVFVLYSLLLLTLLGSPTLDSIPYRKWLSVRVCEILWFLFHFPSSMAKDMVIVFLFVGFCHRENWDQQQEMTELRPSNRFMYFHWYLIRTKNWCYFNVGELKIALLFCVCQVSVSEGVKVYGLCRSILSSPCKQEKQRTQGKSTRKNQDTN